MNIVLFGLSGSGKTTISKHLCTFFDTIDVQYRYIDGDLIRQSNSEWGYTVDERINMAKAYTNTVYTYSQQNIMTISGICMGLKEQREYFRKINPDSYFIYLDCPIEICIQRDPKKLYSRFECNEIKDMIGLDIPFDIPVNPDLIINSVDVSPEDNVKIIMQHIRDNYDKFGK